MRRLYGLDALRGIAATMVFLLHLRTLYKAPYVPFAAELSVDLFFLLSGFVMARTYDERFATGLTPARFIALRYVRLWFPLALGTVLGFIVVQTLEGPSLGLTAALGVRLLFLPAPWHGWFGLNRPAWSIFVEIASNAVHAGLGRTRALAICLAFSAIIFVFTTAVEGNVLWSHDLGSTAGSIFRGLTSYLLGVLLFRRFGDQPLGGNPRLAIAAYPAILALGAMTLPYAILAPLAVFILFPLIIRASLGLGESRWAEASGAISFPLYAVHFPIIATCSVVGLPPAIAAVSAILAALGVTILFELRRKPKVLPIPDAQTA